MKTCESKTEERKVNADSFSYRIYFVIRKQLECVKASDLCFLLASILYPFQFYLEYDP